MDMWNPLRVTSCGLRRKNIDIVETVIRNAQSISNPTVHYPNCLSPSYFRMNLA